MTKLLLSVCMAAGCSAWSQGIVVRHAQGATRGFLALRSEDGRLLASGEVTQSSHGDMVTSRLTFTFLDGSVDDDTTTFSQRGTFRLVRDHHIQRGPFFEKPLEMTVDVPAGTVTVTSFGKDGREQVETEHKELPAELANGMLQTLLLNVPKGVAPFKVPYLAPSGSKSRLVQLAISPAGTAFVRVVGVRHAVSVFRVHIELGGVAGVVAPLAGKEPKDAMFWILEGSVPAAMRIITQLAADGPQVSIEQSGVSVASVGLRAVHSAH